MALAFVVLCDLQHLREQLEGAWEEDIEGEWWLGLVLWLTSSCEQRGMSFAEESAFLHLACVRHGSDTVPHPLPLHAQACLMLRLCVGRWRHASRPWKLRSSRSA